MDLFINENFDVELDDRNDLAVVDGRDAVEQSIALMVNTYFYEEIGSTQATNAVENIELHARRIIQDSQYVTSIIDLTVEKVESAIEVTLFYETGETAILEIGEN